jgi:hypothetical protein
MKNAFGVLACIVLLLAGCGQQASPPTEVALAPTETTLPPTPTPIPPTPTPLPPTETPLPSTPTPVPPTATAVPPTATAVPPTATATETPTPELSGCERVLGRCIEIVYEDESCTQVGPETLQAGMMTLVRTNWDYDNYIPSLMLLEDGKTWSDVEEYFGPLPSSKPIMTWAHTMGRLAPGIGPYNSVRERLELTAGTYFSICNGPGSPGVVRPTALHWLGGTLTVED